MQDSLKGAAVVFDLDGTLIDTADDLAASMNHVLEKNGFAPVAPARVRHLVGRGARKMLGWGFTAAAGAPPDAEEMAVHLAQFLAHYEANIAVRSQPFPYVPEVLETLRGAGARIAVCTNKRERLARLLLKALSMDALMDAVVGADTAAAPKPDPAPVLVCLERTGTARGVFVGDSDTDIAAAGAAGLACIIATFGYGPLERAGEALAVFDDYRALPDLVEQAAKKAGAI
ncbi:MAG: HAD-IA family hydrolase [Parvularculaceae bacterium]